MNSDAIGDASLIGLECESGDFSDCDLNAFSDHIPIGCEKILMFSDSNNQCGKLCKSNRSKRSALPPNATIKTGWTVFYMNTDHPNGTGDHEHYFYYVDGNHDRLTVYDSDGQAYSDCTKKAIHVREKDTNVPWWTLATSYTLLFSKFKYDDDTVIDTDFSDDELESHAIQENTEVNQMYSIALKPDYG